MIQQPVSLHSPVGENDDNLGDFIADPATRTPAEIIGAGQLKSQIDGIVSGLSARQRRVLELRFGLNDGQPHTLEEIGGHLNITRERVRQIEADALKKMRHPGPAPSPSRTFRATRRLPLIWHFFRTEYQKDHPIT